LPQAVLLDISVVADYLAGDQGAGALIEKALSGEVAASISTMSVLQLWRAQVDDRRAEIRLIALLRFVEQLPVTAEVARVAGQMCARSGDGPRVDEEVMEAVNVAVSRDLGVPVCTRDVRAYQVHGCETVPY
jgi:predicted nucleic acid-binding protein